MANKKQNTKKSIFKNIIKKLSNIEFSKLLTISIVLIFSILGVWSVIEYYYLVKLAIESNSNTLPDCSLPVACITTILGTLLTYCLYQSALKASLNKNKLMIDKTTNVVRSIVNSDIIETIINASENEGEEE